MKNKNIYIAAGVVAIVLIIFFAGKANVSAPSPERTEEQTTNSDITSSGDIKTSPQSPEVTKTTPQSTKNPIIKTVTQSKFPEIDFIDKRIIFPLENYPDVKITIEKVAFGRGDAVESTGCSGIPNANFSTYLYPGSSVCISSELVDGSPRGIIALHMLIENKGNLGFGGNSDLLKLHYLRSDSTGKPSYRFAYPLMGLANYYINGYSSKEVMLSYLVPEDQLIYNLVSGYKEPMPENKTLNVYDFSSNGLLVDFSSKSLKIVK